MAPWYNFLDWRHWRHRTLGVHLTPKGESRMEFNYLHNMAKQWQTAMAMEKLTHSAAEFSMRQVILQKLEYPLVTTTFTKTQCKEILKPIWAQGLPATGLNCTFPCAIVHGPRKWGVINIPHLYTKQLYSHIHMNLKFMLRTQDVTSSLLQVSYEAMKMELVGHTRNIFDCPTCLHTCLMDSWITHTWEACHQANI